MTDARPPFAWRGVGIVVAVQVAVLLAMAPFYGPGRDEVYFVSAGQRLAGGYPDQPSFTPFLPPLSSEGAPHPPGVLRLWGLVGGIGIGLGGGRVFPAARGGPGRAG